MTHASRRFSLPALVLALGPALAASALAQQQPRTTASTGASAPAQPRPANAAPNPAAAAQQPPSQQRPGALGNLGSSKEPIKIDADRLDVFDREGRAVFTGNVVAVQGDSTIRCSVLTVTYEQNRGGAQGGTRPASSSPGAGGDSAIKHLDCKGPVTVTSKTQTATSDNAEFDRQANRVVMTGNVALNDGPNVTRGDRIVYDLNTGVANVENKPGGRVRALITPGSGTSGEAPQAAPQAGAQPPKPKPSRTGQAAQPTN